MTAEDLGSPPVSRLERRKAQTRQSLLDAARKMIADGSATSASIADITDAADVGFGSFYNHFDDKSSLFAAALEQVLAQWGDRLELVEALSADPAERFITSFRLSARYALLHRQEAEIMSRYGFSLLDSPTGLGPRAHRDLTAAVAAGRFVIPNVTLATAITAGYLLALLHLWLADDSSVGEQEIDESAEALLKNFGMKPAAAKKLAHAEFHNSQI